MNSRPDNHHNASALPAGDPSSDLQEALGRSKKEIARLTFRLDRAVKEKQTLSTLLARTSEDLEKSSEIIKQMFGRYLSTEVMNSLLQDPTALKLGGERRMVTIMITDLRGFSAISERLTPEQVVQMLNGFFDVMVDIILGYQGTINEIIGDALLVIFGAPQSMADRTQRAVACAIAMQNAMAKVNALNRDKDLPELEMGIGINETEVVVGNIGSNKRSKYAVVGSGVNITSRIESFSVGGQVLISASVKQKIGHQLLIESQQDVIAKGFSGPMTIYSISGISGDHNQSLMANDPPRYTLAKPISFRYVILEGANVNAPKDSGVLRQLSTASAEVDLSSPVNRLVNLQMELTGVDQKLASKKFYGKVIQTNGSASGHTIRFTSVPPEIDAYFLAHLQYAVDRQPTFPAKHHAHPP